MIKTALIYNHRGRLGKDGTAPVEVRVTVNRRAYYINTGVHVRPRDWKHDRVRNCENEETLNERISIMLKRVDDIINEHLNDCTENDIDFKEVRRLVRSPDKRVKRSVYHGDTLKIAQDSEDMTVWMQDEIKKLDVAHGTRKHYKVSVAALIESCTMRKWSELTVENVHKFDAFLHTIKKHQTDAEIKAGKAVEYIGQATVRNYHKDIKALLGRALKFGLINANPYDRMRGEIKRGDKETVEFLTDAERERIEGMTIAEGSMLCTVRDMFLFQCYTGMAYQDMLAFSLDRCQKVGDKLTYSAERVKTGVTFYIRILPNALAIAEKYGGRLPNVADQVCNRNLKTIAMVAGISKKLTTHVGRHTFATWALRNGIPIERVSRMLGHTKITQTQRYAKVLAMDVYQEFDKLDSCAGSAGK